MPEAVIVSALRTPIGTAIKGTLRDTDAYQLADHVVGSAVADLDRGDAIDDVILGEGLYGGGVVARHAAITAGLTSVPGLALNRHCAAGQAAVQSAAASVRAGMDQLDHRRRRELRVDVAHGSSAGRAPETNGSTGSRRRTPTVPTRPTWTCRSRSAGTPRSRRV